MKGKRKIRAIIVSVLVVALIAIHIPKYQTSLWIGTDTDDLSQLFDRNCVEDICGSYLDLKVEIDGNIVYQTDSTEFTRCSYTRRDVPLRAGFHKIKIASKNMNLNIEKIRYTLFDYYIEIEIFTPSTEKDSRRARVTTGFMPIQFM